MLGLLKKMGTAILGINPILFVAAVALFGVSGLVGMVQYNQSNYFCQKCHRIRGPYVSIHLDSKSHKPFKDGTHGCLACHRDKDFYDWALGTAGSFAGFMQDYTNPAAIHYEAPDMESDAKCLRCHYNQLEYNQTRPLELTGNLRKIGLKFDHAKHYAFRDFDRKKDARLKELSAKRGRTEDEKKEMEFLEKVRYSNCAICHERVKDAPGGGTFIDKTVNYFTTNPMTCSSCHKDALRNDHPGHKLAVPSEESCRWCHNGKLHARMVFFPADKTSPDRTACVKCHPDYKRSMDRDLGLIPAEGKEAGL